MPAGLTAHRSSAGYALLEYLAALTLTAAGVLGLLQTSLLNARLEQTVLDRIRANLLLTDLTRKMDSVPTAPNAFSIGLGTAPVILQDCRTAHCTDSDRAAFYLAHWKCRLGRWMNTSSCRRHFAPQGQLPQGDGSISAETGGFRITLHWQPPGKPAQMLTHYHAPFAE